MDHKKCPGCGKMKAVKKDGTFVAHWITKAGRKTLCDGSGMPAK